ncbi:hypothetical protein [Halomonas sp. E14]|uniref:hypothetical protein n=1 Tax=Halomonas sp. E14 TaxID=3397245 RepID=UPI00403E39B6
MPESRPVERRPIVPDPDASLTRSRRYAPPRQRLWPVKLVTLLLVVAVAGLGWLGWQEQQRLHNLWQQLAGEMSNLHARFDAEEGRGDRLEGIESRLYSIEAHGESVVARMAGLEAEVRQVTQHDAPRVESLAETLAAIEAQLDRLNEEAQTRDALLGAIRLSVDAIERAGEEGRQALAARLDTVAEGSQQHAAQIEDTDARLQALVAERDDQQVNLTERVEALEQRFDTALDQQAMQIDERLDARDDAMTQRLAALSEQLESLNEQLDAISEVQQGLPTRITAMEAELLELRQAQLSLSAGLEALQQ